VCFDGAPRHVELAGNFIVVAALQQEVGNLLFSGPKTNGLIFHFCELPPQTKRDGWMCPPSPAISPGR
jgi:hypothetical protein